MEETHVQALEVQILFFIQENRKVLSENKSWYKSQICYTFIVKDK